MVMTGSRLQSMSATLMAVVVVLMWVLSCPPVATADVYSDSGHGSTAYGVNRSGTPDDELRYHTGSCAHCHDTFDSSICSNPLMLFATDNPTSQTDNFCFQCHSGNGTYCYAEGGSSATATWRPNIHTTANYKVYAWWAAGSNRAPDAPYTICYADINTKEDCYPIEIVCETVTVNQRENGGQWNLLGTYPFSARTQGYVVLSNDANGYVIADAIKWEFDSWTPCYDTYGDPPSFYSVVDNLTADFVGDWTCLEHPGAHPDGGTGSVQVGGIVNNDYGTTFGGGAPVFDSVYDAFNPAGTYASSHDLATVQSYAKARGWGSWMTVNTNACLVCHDQHLSQKNFPVAMNLDGGVNTAVRRGNDVNNYPGDLWGDQPYTVSGRNEMMSDWTSAYVYQAPYYVGGSNYEPANNGTPDGSNLPNFVDACAQTCHRKANVPDVLEVNWKLSSTTGWPGDPSRHGKKAAEFVGFGILEPPYSNGYDPGLQSDGRGDYVLSCTDCHEPHGSTNPTLLRTTVNGVSGLSTGGPGSLYPGGARWYYWCQACHDLEYHYDPEHPDCVGSEDPLCGLGHPVIWPDAHCGDNVGCHMYASSGGNHGYKF